MHDLVLGTAQWGDAYGITNRAGRLTDEAVAEIAAAALDSGITRVDTAAGYGDAHERLRPWADRFEVTTKVSGSGETSVTRQVEQSLSELGVDRIHGCLIHDWPGLSPSESEVVVGALQELVAKGLVEVAGISAYDESDLDRALGAFGHLGAAQVPVNLLDQRLVDSQAIRALTEAGVTIQARSVLLQGLLAGPTEAPLGQHSDIARFWEWCAQGGVDPIAVSLAFIRSQAWIHEVIVGVTSADELRAIMDAWRTDPDPLDFGHFASTDVSLLDPRQWAKG
jgi:aryl-alcohol dehydrogenase-like predicted oxidoreductase